MIGSHNTMTYLKAKSKLWEMIKGYWRCQDKTLDEQIAMGVRWFDIRVVYNESSNHGSLWRFAHGAIDLKSDFSLRDVLDKIESCGGYVRIMLERGDEYDEELFRQYFDINRVLDKWPCIVGAVIKHEWRVLWSRSLGVGMRDCSYVPYKRDTAWWKQIWSIIPFPFKSIKSRAKANKKDFESHKKDNKTIYVYDYV